MKKFLVTVVGPTAVGKTKVSISIAQHYHTSIISADARQFYKEMKIGTAVPSLKELHSVPHYFIQHLSVTQPYTAGDFEKEALEILDSLFRQNDVVVLSGGSGLFIRALLKGLDKFPDVAPAIADELNRLYQSQGLRALQQLLKEKDPVYDERVDRNNPLRLLRALGVCMTTGKPYSSFLKQQTMQRNFIPIQIGLQLERTLLYQQIDERVISMMRDGLLEEVKPLIPYATLAPLQTVGYRELFQYLREECTLDQAVNQIKQHSRNYAKRQLTWFRKEKDITWFQPDQLAAIILFIKTQMQ